MEFTARFALAHRRIEFPVPFYNDNYPPVALFHKNVCKLIMNAQSYLTIEIAQAEIVDTCSCAHLSHKCNPESVSGVLVLRGQFRSMGLRQPELCMHCCTCATKTLRIDRNETCTDPRITHYVR
jgi:hypothetical protein